MKVKDLIRKLEQFDENAELIFFYEQYDEDLDPYACQCDYLTVSENGDAVQLFMNDEVQ